MYLKVRPRGTWNETAVCHVELSAIHARMWAVRLLNTMTGTAGLERGFMFQKDYADGATDWRDYTTERAVRLAEVLSTGRKT